MTVWMRIALLGQNDAIEEDRGNAGRNRMEGVWILHGHILRLFHSTIRSPNASGVAVDNQVKLEHHSSP